MNIFNITKPNQIITVNHYAFFDDENNEIFNRTINSNDTFDTTFEAIIIDNIDDINNMNEGNIIRINTENDTKFNNKYYFVSFKTKSNIIITPICYHAKNDSIVLDYRHSYNYSRNDLKIKNKYCYCWKFRFNIITKFYKKYTPDFFNYI